MKNVYEPIFISNIVYPLSFLSLTGIKGVVKTPTVLNDNIIFDRMKSMEEESQGSYKIFF